MSSMPDADADTAAAPIPDERLIAAHDLALSALHEITAEATVGQPAGYSVEPDGVVSLRFENRLPGYPGWYWTVSLARVDDDEPTVLEVELLPGEAALLAPEWVPWAVRLAEYRAQQEAAAAAAAEAGEDTADEADAEDDVLDDDVLDDDDLDDEDDDDLDDDDLDDLDDLDASDFDADGSPILHAGDLDGVDIDELDDPEAD